MNVGNPEGQQIVEAGVGHGPQCESDAAQMLELLTREERQNLRPGSVTHEIDFWHRLIHGKDYMEKLQEEHDQRKSTALQLLRNIKSDCFLAV